MWPRRFARHRSDGGASTLRRFARVNLTGSKKYIAVHRQRSNEARHGVACGEFGGRARLGGRLDRRRRRARRRRLARVERRRAELRGAGGDEPVDRLRAEAGAARSRPSRLAVEARRRAGRRARADGDGSEWAPDALGAELGTSELSRAAITFAGRPAIRREWRDDDVATRGFDILAPGWGPKGAVFEFTC